MPTDYLFTSESVTEGHPDKIADQISDGVLDAILAKDPQGRIAVETLVKTGLAIVAGEVTTNCYVDIPRIVRGTICRIGYTESAMGYDGRPVRIDAVVVSSQHSEEVSNKKIHEAIREDIIAKALPKSMVDKKTKF